MGRVSGKRWNDILEAAEKRYDAILKYGEDALLADGYPPFTVPLPERERYMRLIAMRDGNDPAFWHDPQAVRELAKLAAKYGHPPRRTIGPYGEQSQHESTQSIIREGW